MGSSSVCSPHLCRPATRSFSSLPRKLPPTSKTLLSPVFATDPQNLSLNPLLAILTKSPFVSPLFATHPSPTTPRPVPPLTSPAFASRGSPSSQQGISCRAP